MTRKVEGSGKWWVVRGDWGSSRVTLGGLFSAISRSKASFPISQFPGRGSQAR